MRLGAVVLPEGIRGKVEGFVAGRTGGTAKTKPDGFAANAPGTSGFLAAGAHFVGPLGRSPATTFAALRVDRLAVRETELTPPNLIALSDKSLCVLRNPPVSANIDSCVTVATRLTRMRLLPSSRRRGESVPKT